MSLIRRLVQQQVKWSRLLEQRLPQKFRIDGNRDFITTLIPANLSAGLLVYDVGGGKQPAIDREVKEQMNLRVVGLDISADELAEAPAGSYDQVVVSDLSAYRGREDGDLAICQAVLEHVADVPSAFQALASMLKPGGKAVIFVPSRNAVFARLNLLLPERLKRLILFSIFPQKRHTQGFPAYYHLCTPRDFERLAAANNLVCVKEHLYFSSGYFSFFFPLHVFWRAWVLLFHSASPRRAAETFSVILQKQ